MASPEALVSALADPERLQLFARICTAPGGLPAPGDRQSARHAKRLVAAGLVALSDGRYHAVPGVFRDALAKPAADPLDALFSRGRLVAIPRPGPLRETLFAYLAGLFEPGHLYTERDVREKLTVVHDDHAALRRYLVDEGFLQRSNDGGTYGRPTEAR